MPARIGCGTVSESRKRERIYIRSRILIGFQTYTASFLRFRTAAFLRRPGFGQISGIRCYR